MKRINKIVLIFLIELALLNSPAKSYAENRIRPFNRIVIMIDRSKSYEKRMAEALKKAITLTEKISNRKNKRHEGKDEVIVISLDAIPEVIWRGTKDQLKAESLEYWKQRFDSRSDYERCTDVENGLLLAAEELHKEPEATNMYIFAFTDLINEPPAGSATKCEPVILPSLPSKEFPLDVFSDVQVHVLWAPINQKQAWVELAQAAGLTDFHLYSESESGVIAISAPERAKHIMTEEEREQGKQRIMGIFKGVGKFVLYGFGIVVLLIGGGGLLTAILSKRNNKARR